MALEIRTVGSGRYYSTLAAWAADLEDTGEYASGDIARAEIYGQLTITSAVVVSLGGALLSEVQVAGADSEYHAGVAGAGARIVASGDGSDYNMLQMQPANIPSLVEKLEFDGAGLNLRGCVLFNKGTGDPSTSALARHLLCHDLSGNKPRYLVYTDTQGQGAGNSAHIYRCIGYDLTSTASNSLTMFATGAAAATNGSIDNCTTYGGVSQLGTVRGFSILNDVSSSSLCNNCGFDIDDGVFTQTSPANIVASNNVSDDATAANIGTTGIDPANVFVDYANRNLLLKSGADAAVLDGGVGLGTSPTSIDVGIQGNTVSGTWDVGADEFAAAGGGATVPVLAHHYRQMMAA